MAPMIWANNNNGELYYVSAASGGMAGVLAQAELFYAVTEERIPLEAAMLRSRRRPQRLVSLGVGCCRLVAGCSPPVCRLIGTTSYGPAALSRPIWLVDLRL